MIRISPFTPLFFTPSTDKTSAGSRYVQTFACSDRIFIEVLADANDDAPALCLRNCVSGFEQVLDFSSWIMPSQKKVFFHFMENLPEGLYTVGIGEKWSELFYVTDNEQELENTVLIQYANKDNRDREDVVFNIAYVDYFFEFRVPAGFKDNGWTFEAETEQFVTAESDIVSLYAKESTQKTLTMGGQIGCPIWFGEHLNRLLCCKYVYIDGVRYCRKESSTPEPTEALENSRSFVFKQLLQQVVYIEPEKAKDNLIRLRRIGKETDDYRFVDDSNVRSLI